jgi:hypothetical protein
MVEALISDAQLPTQDGGKSSEDKELIWLMTKERLSKFKVELTLKTETLLQVIETTMLSTNNGISSTLINGRENQLRVNSIRDSVSMLKETSTLSHNFQTIDTLILSTTGTWLSRLRMEEEPKCGTSINNL